MFRASYLLILLVVAGIVDVLLYADVIRYVLPERVPAPAADVATHPRFVCLGVSGMDYNWLTRYFEEDARRLPSKRRLVHLARLRAMGALHPLRSEIPPESPVAWASMITGVHPGRHGIFDFVRPGANYRPLHGMIDLRRMRLVLGRIPVRPPQIHGRLASPTFLERIQAAGYPVVSLRQPMLFPARPVPGARMLAGLGTPDIAGGTGSYTVWSSRVAFPEGDTVFGGVQIRLDPTQVGPFRTHLPGPVDPTLDRGADGRLQRGGAPLEFEILEGCDPPQVAIRLAGRTVTAGVGERTPFMDVPFRLGTWPPITVRGQVRFEVKEIDPLVVLADPVNAYGSSSAFPLTTPPDYAEDLFRRYGPLETVGWAEQTFALNDGYQDDEGFVRDLLEDMDRDAGVLLGELARGGSCVFQVFSAAYVPGRVEELGEPMLTLYSRVDRIVGDVLDQLDPDDVLVVCSEHGTTSWRWEVALNQWLVEEGYMTPKHGGGADAVDWSRTRAYAMGLGQIYLNIRGREGQGIVDPADVPALAREIRAKLLDVRNPFRPDDHPVREVYLLQELYDGPEVHAAAEIQVGFDAGYQVSWQTAFLGGLGREVFEENDLSWSGAHGSTDVSVVEGILLVNRPVPPAPPGRPYQVCDVAATACAFFGLDTSGLDGRPVPLSTTTRPVRPSSQCPRR